MTSLIPARTQSELLEVNRHFYNALWSDARLIEPERLNTWPLVRSLLAPAQRRLEVAPGLRPRLPIEDTQFVDISAAALGKLRARGGSGTLGSITALPYGNAGFDLICAFDVIEHVDDDERALAELSRVAAKPLKRDYLLRGRRLGPPISWRPCPRPLPQAPSLPGRPRRPPLAGCRASACGRPRFR